MRAAVLLALLFAACDTPSPDKAQGTDSGVGADCPGGEQTWYLDADGDGFGSSANSMLACDAPVDHVSDAGDCDDDLATAHPDADETCADDVDNDCDGAINEDDAVDAATWYADADGDGFGDPEADVVACEAPDGFGADATDCDDGDPAVFPGAEEVCGDGIDNNCVDEPWADHECGLPATGAFPDAGVEIRGVSEGDIVGRSVGWAPPASSEDSGYLLLGAYGVDVGGNQAGAMYLLPGGAVDGDVDVGAAAVRFHGEETGEAVGYAVSTAGDTNSDGYVDVVVSAKYAGGGGWGNGTGAAYLLLGPFDADFDTYGADASIRGAVYGDKVGESVAGGRDLTGDGVADLLIGAPSVQLGGDAVGAVYVVSGGRSGEVSLVAAHARLLGVAADDRTGNAVTQGDLNGDGLADAVVGARTAGGGQGAVYVVNGPVGAGDHALSAADATWTGEGPDSHDPPQVRGMKC